MARLAVGDKAPDFELLDQRGEKVKLSKLVKEHSRVLCFFYPQY